MRTGSVVLVTGGVFAFGFLAGYWAGGSSAPPERPAEARARATPAPRAPVDEATRPAPEDGAALARIEAELRALREEVASIRTEGAPAAGHPSAQAKPSAGEDGQSLPVVIGGGRPWPALPDLGRVQMEKLGLSPSQQADVERSIREERERILERFKASIPPDQWEAYRAARRKGPHRATQGDFACIRDTDDLFKRVQEQVLAENASRYAGCSDRQREGLEGLRGGFLNVGDDGAPVVESAPSGAMVFRTIGR